MMQVIQRRKNDIFAVMLGIILSLVFVPPTYYAWARLLDALEDAFPVVEAKLASWNHLAPDGIALQLYVTRKDNCRMVRVYAFTGPKPSAMQPTPVRRLDGAEPVDYPVGITVKSAVWVLSPVHGLNVSMHGYYECNGRLVRASLLETDLSKELK